MLYILQLFILLIWLIYIVSKEKYSIHAVIFVYFFFVTIVDIVEGVFTYYFEFYSFSPHLLVNQVQENQLGLIFCDGYLLPFTGIILLHYATKAKNLWGIIFNICYNLWNIRIPVSKTWLFNLP